MSKPTKARVITREVAKKLQKVPTKSTPPPSKPQPRQPSPSLLSRLRTRYTNTNTTTTTLPRPIHRTLRILRYLAPLVPIGFFFSEHVAQVMWVRGPSMTPYINEDYEEMHTSSDMVLVKMWANWPWERKRGVERGMVVTFRSPANPSHVAIKRVVGLPGDKITTRDPCLKPSQIVPFNHVWLEGDAQDPKKSLDSNTYGPVSISLLTGRVVGVLWPRFRWLRWTDWENGTVDGTGGNYRQGVRNRVVKGAVDMERAEVE